jgi:hypothetical protein
MAGLSCVVAAACGKRSEYEMARAKADVSSAAQSVAKLRVEESAGRDANPTPRKIIRDLEIALAVTDAGNFLRAVERLVAQSGGYVSDKRVTHEGERILGGTLTLRVPSERLDGAGEALHALGTVESETLKADDISEQYYDLAARLTNMKRLEERLLALLTQRSAQLSEIVTLESKLAEVREQIERLEGKQRLWDNQVALSTIRLTFRVPVVTVAQEPVGFFAELGSTLKVSVTRLLRVGRGASVVVVALLPWAALALAGVLLGRWALGRWTASAVKGGVRSG